MVSINRGHYCGFDKLRTLKWCDDNDKLDLCNIVFYAVLVLISAFNQLTVKVLCILVKLLYFSKARIFAFFFTIKDLFWHDLAVFFFSFAISSVK